METKWSVCMVHIVTYVLQVLWEVTMDEGDASSTVCTAAGPCCQHVQLLLSDKHGFTLAAVMFSFQCCSSMWCKSELLADVVAAAPTLRGSQVQSKAEHLRLLERLCDPHSAVLMTSRLCVSCSGFLAASPAAAAAPCQHKSQHRTHPAHLLPTAPSSSSSSSRSIVTQSCKQQQLQC